MMQAPLMGLPNPLRKPAATPSFFYQEFCCGAETIELKASPGDSQTEWRAYILWDDIREAFPATTRLECGKRAITFMSDGNGNRLYPLRIEYEPDCVIQVIESRVPSLSNFSISDTHSIARSTRSFRSHSQQSEMAHTIYTRSYRTPSIFTSWNGQDRNRRDSVASFNPSITLSASDEPTSRFRTSFYLYEAFLQSIHDGKSDQVELIMNGLNEGHFDSADTRYSVQSPDEHIQEAEVTAIQSRVQAILMRQYQWHHSPFPRLFIVLPKDGIPGTNNNDEQGSQYTGNDHFSKLSWDLGNLDKVCSNFRIHFLCECGNHSRRSRSSKRHCIHLTRHPGFDLETPTEFFRRYGHYVLRVLQMIKYGVSVNGYHVPELTTPSDRSDSNSDIHFSPDDLSGPSMEPAVNLTIEFLKYLGATGHLLGPQRMQQGNLQQLLSNNRSTEEYESLGGADLRRLAVFLRGVHSNKALSNFYRIMDEEGHVRWVCRDHYLDSYDHTLMKELTGMIASSKSTFDDQLGFADVVLRSPAVATEFYKMMEESKLIQELRVRVKWDASMSDFKALRDVIQHSTVARLELVCTGSASAAADLLSRGKKSDPLWQMISQSKLQSFVLTGYSGFFSRVSISAKTNRLRILKITERLDWKKDQAKVVEWIESSPHLRELLLSCTDVQEAYKIIRKLNYETCSLTQLILDGGDTNGVQAWFERGVPVAMDLVVSSLSDPLLKETRVIRALHVRPGLQVPSDIEADLLTGVINKNSNLAKLVVQCAASQFLPLHIAVKEVLNNDESSKLNTLRLYGGSNQLTILDLQGNASIELELMTMNASPATMDSLLRVYGNQLVKLKVEGNILKPLFDMAFQGIPMIVKHIEIVGSRMTPDMCYELRKVVGSTGEKLKFLSIQLDKPWSDSMQSDELANLVVDMGPKWSKIWITEMDKDSMWLKVLADRGFAVPLKVVEKLGNSRMREGKHQGHREAGGERMVERERRFSSILKRQSQK